MFTEIGSTEKCEEGIIHPEKPESFFSVTEKEARIRIVAVGIGGMGQNAMENLALENVEGLEIYSVNTDMQALSKCNGSRAVQIGKKRTCGRGAGGDSEIGRMSAEDDLETLKGLLSGAELVFVAAGMGGGTGTGAAPVIGRICREMGIMTIGVVTTPMNYEGPKRMEKARAGLASMRRIVDSLMIIENEKLITVMNDEDISIINAFRKADGVLVDGLKSVARMINMHGYINLDLADLMNVVKRQAGDKCGDIMIGVGEARGEDRACRAAHEALNNPLLSNSNIYGSANLLVNVAGSEGMGLQEALEAVRIVEEKAGNVDREIFMGVVTDNDLGDVLSVTVIANGLGTISQTVKEPVKLMQMDVKRVVPAQNRIIEDAGSRYSEKVVRRVELISDERAIGIPTKKAVEPVPEIHSRALANEEKTSEAVSAKIITQLEGQNIISRELEPNDTGGCCINNSSRENFTKIQRPMDNQETDEYGLSPLVDKESWKTPAGLRRELLFPGQPEGKIVNLEKRGKESWRNRVLTEADDRQSSLFNSGMQAVCS